MSADWEVGDLALCIKIGPWLHAGHAGPKTGGIYSVRGVAYRDGKAILWLVGFPGEQLWKGFYAFRFRKVTPPKADAFDLETINLMNPKPVEAVR